jgi:aldehyde dehydrogenase (NAD+)
LHLRKTIMLAQTTGFINSGNLINGVIEPIVEPYFISTNPANQRDEIGKFPESSAADVERACLAAKDAFQKWRNVPAPVRGQVLGRAAGLLREHKNSLAKLVRREIGKVNKEALGSVQEAIDTAEFFLSEGRRLYGQTVPSEMRFKELQTYRRPFGVCGIITAGNFPVAVPSWKIIPALLCGNTIVWKPSQDAPATAMYFALILQAAGLPKGVLNVVQGGASAGQSVLEMVESGLIQKIAFTGSSAVGKKIGEVCGRNLQVPTLELGGKNPLIVMEDANLDLAVEGALWAAFGTAGQRCTSLGNLILHQSIATEFTERFLERVDALRVGDPNLDETVDYGSLIAPRFLEQFLAHFEMGKRDGATLLRGSQGRVTAQNQPDNFVGNPEQGLFVFPTVWTDVTIAMDIAQTEIFGPTVNILTAADFDEAIAIANGTPYGLSSAIYTNNPTYRNRFKTEIQAGMSSINNSTSGAEAHMPFGGVKASGNGTRESGIWVLDSYTYWQAVNVDDSGGLQLAQIGTESLAGDEVAQEQLNTLFGQKTP